MRSLLRKPVISIICILALIILVLPLIIACGGNQQPPQTAQQPGDTTQPQGNRPPIISSLTPATWTSYPSGAVEIQVVASDPDGDQVGITWQATGGTINGAGYVVQWQAPNQYGTYTITAVASDGKGGTAQQSIDLGVSANQAPTLESLTAKPPTVGLTASSTISCIANDPDGDVITYNWSADEGNITGVGDTVTYVAPQREGVFNVIVKLTDGKGGETIGSVPVTVAGSTRTVTINYTQQETGTVSSDGDRDNSKMMAGDDGQNIGYRAFFSFNIFSLNNTEIKNAKLIFSTRRVTGDPFIRAGAQSLGGLWIRKVTYSDKLPDFNIISNKLEKQSAVIYQAPTSIEVTPEMVYAVNSGVDRFQVEAMFDKIQNANNVAENIEWTDCKLEVTYTEK
jgi:hypothetical protein